MFFLVGYNVGFLTALVVLYWLMFFGINKKINKEERIMEMWIARDKDGDLFLFQLEPFRDTDMFMGGVYMGIENYLFPEVTWENSPKKVELKLVEE